MKARISQLSKTETEWLRIPDFIPLQGELIVYNPDNKHPYARLKIGDGSTLLRELPFFVDYNIDNFITDNCDKIIDGGHVSAYKK